MPILGSFSHAMFNFKPEHRPFMQPRISILLVMPLCVQRRVPIVAAAWALALAVGCNSSNDPIVINGRMEMDDIHIGSKIGGRVRQVNFEEGDPAKAGEVIVLLEEGDLSEQLDQAKASAAQAKAGLDLLLAGSRREDIARAQAVVAANSAEVELRKKGFRQEEILEAEAQVTSAKSDLQFASAEFARTAVLYEKLAVDRREFDAKKTALETAQAKMEIALQRRSLYRSGSRPEEIAMAQANLAASLADLERLRNGPRREEIAAQRAAVEAGIASIARIEALIDETRIVAPCDATIETLELEPGDLVRAAEPVAVLNLKTGPWVRCYVPENRLGLVNPGDRVKVSVDTFPNETFTGRVRWLSAEAEFTPRNIQTPEKRSELVFEMKVDVLEGHEKIRAGMYADVTIGSQSR